LTGPGETSFTRLALAGSLGAIAAIGAIDSVYGPLLRPLSHRFAVSLAFAGTVISVNFTGALIGVLCAQAAFRRAPTRPIATFRAGGRRGRLPDHRPFPELAPADRGRVHNRYRVRGDRLQPQPDHDPNQGPRPGGPADHT